MVGEHQRRVLVADEEPAVRELTARALHREGLVFDCAIDVLEASQKLERASYDALITDLRTPHRNGHALATDVLMLVERPAVFVLTGVLEPKLTKDLFQSGIDSIDYKPAMFPTKVTSLRQTAGGIKTMQPDAAPGESAGSAPPGQIGTTDDSDGRVRDAMTAEVVYGRGRHEDARCRSIDDQQGNPTSRRHQREQETIVTWDSSTMSTNT